MIRNVLTAEPYIPRNPTLPKLRTAAAACRGCNLWKFATQTVFGEGGSHLRVMLVGEQPGDQEDRQGRPFVGPAGRLLDIALERAQIDRDSVYITNAVKHFKFEPRGKRRIHKKPTVPLAPYVMATVHPSSVLRAPDEQARYLGIEQFVADLVKVRRVLNGTRHGGEP